MPDPFASGPIALVLAWLAAAGTPTGGAGPVLASVMKQAKMATPCEVWLVLRLVLLARDRHLFFKLVAAEASAAQNFTAFFSTFLLASYAPIIDGGRTLVVSARYVASPSWPLGMTRDAMRAAMPARPWYCRSLACLRAGSSHSRPLSPRRHCPGFPPRPSSRPPTDQLSLCLTAQHRQPHPSCSRAITS